MVTTTHVTDKERRFLGRTVYGVAYLPHTLQGNSSLPAATWTITEPGGIAPVVCDAILECMGV